MTAVTSPFKDPEQERRDCAPTGGVIKLVAVFGLPVCLMLGAIKLANPQSCVYSQAATETVAGQGA